MKFTPVVLAAFAALALEAMAMPLNARFLDGDILGGDIVSGDSIIPIISESNPTVVNPKTEISKTEIHNSEAHHHRRFIDGDILGGPILSGDSILPILSESNPTVVASKTKIDSTKIVDHSHEHDKHHHRRFLDGDILGGDIVSGDSIIPIVSESNPTVVNPKTKISKTEIVNKDAHHHRRFLDGDIAGGPILSGDSILPILSESNPTVVAPKTTIDSYSYIHGDDGKWYKHDKGHHRRFLDGDILGGPIASGDSILPILSQSNPTVVAGKTNINSYEYYKGSDGKYYKYGKDHKKEHRRFLDGDILGGPIASGDSILPILSQSDPTVVASKTNIHSTKIVDDDKADKHHGYHRRFLDGDILGGPILSGDSILPILSESNPTVVASKTKINSNKVVEDSKHKDHYRRFIDGDILGGPILSGDSILPILSQSNPTVVAAKTKIDSTKIVKGDKHDEHYGHHRRFLDGDILGGPILSGDSIVPILSESNPTVVASKTKIDAKNVVEGDKHGHYRRFLDGDILGGPIVSGDSIIPILSESNPTVVASKTEIDSKKVVDGEKQYVHGQHRRFIDGDILGGPILSGDSILPILSESNPTVIAPKTQISKTDIREGGEQHHGKWRRFLDGDILGGPIASGDSILPILSESNPTVVASKTNIHSTKIVDKDGHSHGHHRRFLDGDILGGDIVSGDSIIPIISESNPTVVNPKTQISKTEIHNNDSHGHH